MSSSPHQLVVDKQGALLVGSWSSRVITFDSTCQYVFLSCKNHPEHVLYHRMQINEVLPWPHYNLADIEEDAQSSEAQLSVCVRGMCSSFKKSTSRSGSSTSSSTTASRDQQGEAVEKLHLSSTVFSAGKEGQWMLRCCSREDLTHLLTLLFQVSQRSDGVPELELRHSASGPARERNGGGHKHEIRS